jgi:hypothetical protein
MRTDMHQDAYPGEDISDRPLPEERVPGFIELLEGDRPTGRYQAAEIGAGSSNHGLSDAGLRLVSGANG